MPWAAALPASVWCTTGAAARPRCRSRSDGDSGAAARPRGSFGMGGPGGGAPAAAPRVPSAIVGHEPVAHAPDRDDRRPPGLQDLAAEAREVRLEPEDVRMPLGGAAPPRAPEGRRDGGP